MPFGAASEPVLVGPVDPGLLGGWDVREGRRALVGHKRDGAHLLASRRGFASIGDPVKAVMPPAATSWSAGAPPWLGTHLRRSGSMRAALRRPPAAMCQSRRRRCRRPSARAAADVHAGSTARTRPSGKHLRLLGDGHQQRVQNVPQCHSRTSKLFERRSLKNKMFVAIAASVTQAPILRVRFETRSSKAGRLKKMAIRVAGIPRRPRNHRFLSRQDER